MSQQGISPTESGRRNCFDIRPVTRANAPAFGAATL